MIEIFTSAVTEKLGGFRSGATKPVDIRDVSDSAHGVPGCHIPLKTMMPSGVTAF